MENTLRISCPRCGAGGQVPVTYAGRQIHCKRCDTHFTVPQPRPTVPEPRELPGISDITDIDQVRLAPLTQEEREHEERVKAKLIHQMKEAERKEKS